jgi:hypothetical protein
MRRKNSGHEALAWVVTFGIVWVGYSSLFPSINAHSVKSTANPPASIEKRFVMPEKLELPPHCAMSPEMFAQIVSGMTLHRIEQVMGCETKRGWGGRTFLEYQWWNSSWTTRYSVYFTKNYVVTGKYSQGVLYLHLTEEMKSEMRKPVETKY